MKGLIGRLALVLALAMLLPLAGVAEVEVVEAVDAAEDIKVDAPVEVECLEVGDEALPAEDMGVSIEDAGAIGLDVLALEDGDEVRSAGAPVDNDYVTPWQELQQRIFNAYDYQTIALTQNCLAYKDDNWLYFPAGKHLTLDLAGYTLSRNLGAERGEGFVLGVWCDLTVMDSRGGGMITGGWNDSLGGGAYVADGGRLTLKSGTIGYNRAARGGGVWVHEGGTLLMEGGAIDHNTAKECAGGVYVTGSAANAWLTLNGGEIAYNSAGDVGGGVVLYEANLEMLGRGSISGNTARAAGGVYASNGSTALVSGGEISGNTAQEEGGGVFVNGSEKAAQLVVKSSGSIKGNKAKYGGGVFNNVGRFQMNSGTIEQNRGNQGGGVYLRHATMQTNGGYISGNAATEGYGGGVYIGDQSTLTSASVDIIGNTAKAGGGGVAIEQGGYFDMTAGNINKNTAEVGGGVAVGTTAHFKLSGGSLYNNAATAGDGGGVYSWKGAVVEMSGGSLMENRVNSGCHGGGGVFPGTLRVSGKPFIGGNYSGSNRSDCFLGYESDGSYRIFVTGPLTSEAYLTVEYPWPGSGAAYLVTSGLGAKGNLGAFACDDYDYEVRWDYYGAEAELALRGSGPAQPTQPTPVAKINLSKCKITSIKNQTYTGKKLKPAVTVKYGNKKLKKGTDYKVTYSNNIAVGKATVTIKGKGSYTGTRKVTFAILPRSTSISKLSVGKKNISVTWTKRSEGGGYQVQYALKSSFSGAKSVWVKRATTNKVTIKPLKAKKKHYFRVRAYRTVGGKTYYSAWSKTKSVKAK